MDAVGVNIPLILRMCCPKSSRTEPARRKAKSPDLYLSTHP